MSDIDTTYYNVMDSLQGSDINGLKILTIKPDYEQGTGIYNVDYPVILKTLTSSITENRPYVVRYNPETLQVEWTTIQAGYQVIDSLNDTSSTATVNALSANQGHILNENKLERQIINDLVNDIQNTSTNLTYVTWDSVNNKFKPVTESLLQSQQPNWKETNVNSDSYIQNKPIFSSHFVISNNGQNNSDNISLPIANGKTTYGLIKLNNAADTTYYNITDGNLFINVDEIRNYISQVTWGSIVNIPQNVARLAQYGTDNSDNYPIVDWTESNNQSLTYIKNKPHVIDNLTSESGTDVLSANMGRYLNSLIGSYGADSVEILKDSSLSGLPWSLRTWVNYAMFHKKVIVTYTVFIYGFNSHPNDSVDIPGSNNKTAIIIPDNDSQEYKSVKIFYYGNKLFAGSFDENSSNITWMGSYALQNEFNALQTTVSTKLSDAQGSIYQDHNLYARKDGIWTTIESGTSVSFNPESFQVSNDVVQLRPTSRVHLGGIKIDDQTLKLNDLSQVELNYNKYPDRNALRYEQGSQLNDTDYHLSVLYNEKTLQYTQGYNFKIDNTEYDPVIGDPVMCNDIGLDNFVFSHEANRYQISFVQLNTTDTSVFWTTMLSFNQSPFFKCAYKVDNEFYAVATEQSSNQGEYLYYGYVNEDLTLVYYYKRIVYNGPLADGLDPQRYARNVLDIATNRSFSSENNTVSGGNIGIMVDDMTEQSPGRAYLYIKENISNDINVQEFYMVGSGQDPQQLQSICYNQTDDYFYAISNNNTPPPDAGYTTDTQSYCYKIHADVVNSEIITTCTRINYQDSYKMQKIRYNRFNNYFYAIEYDENQPYNSAIYRSTDNCVTWGKLISVPEISQSTKWIDIQFGPNICVAITDSRYYAYSVDDGTSWTAEVYGRDDHITMLCYQNTNALNNKFLQVGNNYILSSLFNPTYVEGLGVKISNQSGNILQLKDDGLYAYAVTETPASGDNPVQVDWADSNSESVSYIRNKPMYLSQFYNDLYDISSIKINNRNKMYVNIDNLTIKQNASNSNKLYVNIDNNTLQTTQQGVIYAKITIPTPPTPISYDGDDITITKSSNEFSVKYDSDYLETTESGLSVNVDDTTIKASSSGLSVIVDDSTIKTSSSKGLYVNVDGNTITTDATGRLKTVVSSSPLNVYDGDDKTITKSSNKFSVRYDSKYLETTSSGLSVNVDDSTIKVDSSLNKTGLYVNIDKQTIQYDGTTKNVKVNVDDISIVYDSATYSALKVQLDGSTLMVRESACDEPHYNKGLYVNIDETTIQYKNGHLCVMVDNTTIVSDTSNSETPGYNLRVKHDQTIQKNNTYGLGVNYDDVTIHAYPFDSANAGALYVDFDPVYSRISSLEETVKTVQDNIELQDTRISTTEEIANDAKEKADEATDAANGLAAELAGFKGEVPTTYATKTSLGNYVPKSQQIPEWKINTNYTVGTQVIYKPDDTTFYNIYICMLNHRSSSINNPPTSPYWSNPASKKDLQDTINSISEPSADTSTKIYQVLNPANPPATPPIGGNPANPPTTTTIGGTTYDVDQGEYINNDEYIIPNRPIRAIVRYQQYNDITSSNTLTLQGVTSTGTRTQSRVIDPSSALTTIEEVVNGTTYYGIDVTRFFGNNTVVQSQGKVYLYHNQTPGYSLYFYYNKYVNEQNANQPAAVWGQYQVGQTLTTVPANINNINNKSFYINTGSSSAGGTITLPIVELPDNQIIKFNVRVTFDDGQSPITFRHPDPYTLADITWINETPDPQIGNYSYVYEFQYFGGTHNIVGNCLYNLHINQTGQY